MIVWTLKLRKEQEMEIYRGTRTLIWGDGYLDCGYGFTGIQRMPKLTKLYTLSMWSLLYVNYTNSKKSLKKLMPLLEETIQQYVIWKKKSPTSWIFFFILPIRHMAISLFLTVSLLHYLLLSIFCFSHWYSFV